LSLEAEGRRLKKYGQMADNRDMGEVLVGRWEKDIPGTTTTKRQKVLT